MDYYTEQLIKAIEQRKGEIEYLSQDALGLSDAKIRELALQITLLRVELGKQGYAVA